MNPTNGQHGDIIDTVTDGAEQTLVPVAAINPPPIPPPKDGAGEWPIFISYRRGPTSSEIAKWLKEELEREPLEAVNGQVFQLNVFVDALEPVHGDFQKYLVPHLQHSRMLIVITDTGASRRRGTGIDYLFDELDWWAKHRAKTAPILLDTDRISAATLIAREPQFQSWGKSSWLECYWNEWSAGTPSKLQQEQLRLLRVIRESIRTYGHDIHLAEVRRLRRMLRWVLGIALIAILSTIGVGGLARQLYSTLVTSESRRYGMSINGARFAINSEDYAAARTTLAECPKSQRQWEWNHLWIKADSSDQQWFAHSEGAHGIVFSLDEKKLYSVGHDGCLKAWEVATGRELFRVCLPLPPTRPGNEAIEAMLREAGVKPTPVRFGPLALSPDGTLLAAGTSRGALKLWRASNGEDVATVENAHEQSILEMAFVSNEILLTGSQDGTLFAWDLKSTPPTSRLIREFSNPLTFCLSEDRTRLAISTSRSSEVNSPSTAILFSLDKDLTLQQLRRGRISPDLVSSLVYFGENHGVVAADYQGDLIFMPESDLAPEVRPAIPTRLKGSELLLALASTRDGKLVASGAKDGRILLWNAAEKRVIRVLPGHQGGVDRLCFSNSGVRLASASDDGEIRIWTTTDSSATEQTLALDFDCWAMSVRPGGKSFAVAGHAGKVRIFSASDCSEMNQGQSEPEQRIDWLQYSPDGNLLVSIDLQGKLGVWNSTTLTMTAIDSNEWTAKQAYFNPAGNIVALFDDGAVRTLNANDFSQISEIVTAIPNTDPNSNPVQVICPLFPLRSTPKSDWCLALARTNGPIEIVSQAGKLSQMLTPVLSGVQCMSFSVDGRLLAVVSFDELICWDLYDRRVVVRIAKPHEKPIRTLVFSPDSRRLCTGSEDSTCKMWDLDEGILLFQCEPLNGIVHGLGFLKHGRDLVIAPCDSSIRILRSELIPRD